MEAFNKILAIFIGLLVILLAIGYAIGKSKTKTQTPAQKNSVFGNLFKPKATPTPTPGSVATNDNIQVISNTVTNEDGSITVSKTEAMGKTPQTIPATGAESAIPLILTSLSSGIYLLKKSKN
ncbi:MAG: hypothetical protein ACMG6E_01580 [Candidatus Roizmanbacteria bacterium]